MGKTFCPYDPDQQLPLPAALQEWLPPDHLAYFISDIARRLREDIAFRALAANSAPDFRTVSDFRKDNLEALSRLFLQALALCQRAGLVKLGHVALDGAKVKANASKHKAMSYRRMKGKEAQLAAEVGELPRRAQAVDVEMDSDHQVIEAARATNLTSDKQQAADMVEETLGNVGPSRRKCPPTRAATRRRR